MNRRTARLLVIDPRYRVLLFQYADTRGRFWATPGGGLEGTESYEDAAAREAREELALDGKHLSPLWDDGAERFFLCKVTAKDIALDERVQDAHLRDGILASRWWSAPELASGLERVYPENLLDRMSALYEAGAPPRARHLSRAELESGFAALPPPPSDRGTLAVIVCRRAAGLHESLERARLSPEEGVPGDAWNRSFPLNPRAQLTLMRRDVSALIAAGQPLTESGDNLVVDLDLATANLPAGTLLRACDAVLEVTTKPHNGCLKFVQRFGKDALRFVQSPAMRPLNLRGIYCRVVEAGEARAGGPLTVISRPQ